MFQKNYLQILERLGDRIKLGQIRDLMSKVSEEVETMLLDEARIRALDADEIEFLRSVRLIDKLKLQRSIDQGTNQRTKTERTTSNRFSPYRLITDSSTSTDDKTTIKADETGTEYVTGKFIQLKIN